LSGRKRKTAATSAELDDLGARLEELEETLRAIRSGEVDALVVSGPAGERVFTLQGADHPYRVMVETINEGAATLSWDGLVLYANQRFADLVATPLERIIGSKLHNFVRTLNCPTLDELLKRAKTAPQKERCDLQTSAGELLPVYVSLSALRHSDFQGVCVIVTDLSELRQRERQLGETSKALECEVAERLRAENAVRETEEMFRLFMNHSPALVFIEDKRGRYVFLNRTVEDVYGLQPGELLGKTPLDWLPGEAGRLLHQHDRDAFSAGESTEQIETIRAREGAPHEWLVVRFPFRNALGEPLLGGVGIDITEQRRAETALRELSARILKLQDEERGRIARELHDSTSQTLTALGLNLGLVATLREKEEDISKVLQECGSLAHRAADEIRNLSHLLYPPDLDRVGLIAAIRWYSCQFAETSGIRIDLDLPAEWKTISQDVRIALFRVFQESLANVRRHSGSLAARVRLRRGEDHMILEVKDKGRGLPSTLKDNVHGVLLVGVGILGMRERLRQLGGRLEIISGSKGTTVRATVPLKGPAQSPAAKRSDG
jgi:PAS domain S-box-containing protein